MNIMWNGLTPRVRQAMAPYEDLRPDPYKQKEKLLHMDFITSKFQMKESDNRSKGHGKKRSLGERVQVRGGEPEGEKKKGEFVAKEVWDKGKIEGRCMKYERSNH